MNLWRPDTAWLRRLAATSLVFGLSACQHMTAQTWGQTDLYLLMGQSNMSGRGLLQTESSEHQTIRVYGNDGLWTKAKEPVDTAVNQIDAVSADPAAGVGPGLFFAQALQAKRPFTRIGLVPCAKGGTSISQWAPSLNRMSLYGSCLARASEAMAQGKIAGILWYQGESDADSLSDAQAWPQRFALMMASFRHDLGQPSLPLVVVGLGDRPMAGPYAARFSAWATVQLAQSQMSLPSQANVSAAGLPRNDDQLHLSTEAQAVLGERLAGAMLTLQTRPQGAGTPKALE